MSVSCELYMQTNEFAECTIKLAFTFQLAHKKNIVDETELNWSNLLFFVIFVNSTSSGAYVCPMSFIDHLVFAEKDAER